MRRSCPSPTSSIACTSTSSRAVSARSARRIGAPSVFAPPTNARRAREKLRSRQRARNTRSPFRCSPLGRDASDTTDAQERVVDAYRARWTIEEYFKALKTGCAIEKRQLTTYDALCRALAIFLPVAWRLLLLRTLARSCPKAPCSHVLTPLQIQILATMAKAPKSVRDGLWAVARMGGHLPRNGEPGWQTIARGFERLVILEAGWNAAMQTTRPDRTSQSNVKGRQA
jgi:hypothetical protein